jgi:hypothetical protein
MSASKKRTLRIKPKDNTQKAAKPLQTKKIAPPPPHQRMLQLIVTFLNDAECAQDMFDMVIPALKEQDNKTVEQIIKNVKLLNRDLKAEGPNRRRVVRHARNLTKQARKLMRSDIMFRNNALVGLVSRYDEYLSALLRAAYRQNPGKATSPEKSLTYDELLTLDNLDNVVELFIEKEIDGILRESHEVQLKNIDREFKTGIIDNFSEYAQFIELMERRNLLVHAGGVASKYYLKKCKQIGWKSDEQIKEGDMLMILEDYFKASVQCLSELAVRIGYALVCRIYPNELKAIHSHLLNDVGFPLLISEQWELARRVFSFVLSWPDKFIPEDKWKRYYSINTALAMNQLNRHEDAITLLDKYDWSSQGPLFLLPIAILKHKWKEAGRIMLEANSDKPFAEDHYRTWPIFKKFRETQEFRRAYKSLYGKRFVVHFSQAEADAIKKATKA